MSRLKGKVAIITGAASGIGAGTAEVFAEQGARLMLVDRNAEGVEANQARLVALGGEVFVFCGDVSQHDVITDIVQSTLTHFGQIDIVFNNAGIMPHGDLREFPEATWDEVLDVNLKSMFLMCKAVVPHMLTARSGSIINTSSVMASLTEPGYEAYSASKAGIIGLTKSIAVSYAEQGIRCNCICPGWVETPMNYHLIDEVGGMDKLTDLIRRQQPQARMATTREVGNVVLFLASDESSAVTGSALYVDGGASAAI